MTTDARVSPFTRPLAVSLYFASHALAATLLALPTTALVAGTGIGRFEAGDRLLFRPGGTILAEVARQLAPQASSHVASSFGAAAIFGVLLLVPHAALLVNLCEREREPQAAIWGRAIAHLPALLALSGAAVLAQTLLFFGTLAVATEFRASLGAWTMRSADLVYFGVVAFGLFVMLGVGLVRDLGRAAVVRGSLGSKAALEAGLKALARAPSRALFGWAAPAAVGLALVALGAVVATLLDVSREGAWRVTLVALVHQAIAYGLCFCRAFWLSASLRIAGTTELTRH
jgi:hypothetical protein